MVLQFEIEDYKRDLKGGNGNGALTHEQIELCLRSTERELDIWNYILKVLKDERY